MAAEEAQDATLKDAVLAAIARFYNAEKAHTRQGADYMASWNKKRGDILREHARSLGFYDEA